ncbi:hypothetical protein BJX76DRAFT_319545, partial [Aspergillus varians]
MDSEIWKFGDRVEEQSSIPRLTVQKNLGQVAEMILRATKANQALNFLVDLKQKHSTVTEARRGGKHTRDLVKL